MFAIDLTARTPRKRRGGGIPVYASAPFEAPEGTRDVDLVRDLLEPGESTTVIGNEAPVLILVTLGTIHAEATDGSAASLRVGEAATFSGDIVLTAEGQAPTTFVAAVIGREAPLQAAAGTPGATPAQTVGSVQVTVYACPPLVEPEDASPGACLRDPEAVGLELAAIDGETLRDVGPSTERQGLPTWVGLPDGEYVLRAASFKEGFGRFFARGLEGTDGGGESGYIAEDDNGYVIPIGGDAADYTIEVYVFAAGAIATPAPGATAVATAEAPASADLGDSDRDGVLRVRSRPRPRLRAPPRPRARLRW